MACRWKSKEFYCENCPSGFTTHANLRRHPQYGCGGLLYYRLFALCLYFLRENLRTRSISLLNLFYVSEFQSRQSRKSNRCSASFPMETHDNYSIYISGNEQASTHRQFQCMKCPSAFRAKGNLVRHLRYECGQGPRFMCPYCGQRYRRVTRTYLHVEATHPGYSVYAIDVQTNLPAKSNKYKIDWLPWSKFRLTAYISSKVCSTCRFFYRRKVLTRPSMRRQKLNQSQMRYACPKCQKSYKHVHHMMRHLKFECDSPPRFQCPYCGMRSKQSNNVYKHIRAVHPGCRLEILRLNYDQWRIRKI